MRHIHLILLLGINFFLSPTHAENHQDALELEYQFSLETMRMDHRTLGREPDEDRVEAHTLEFEIGLEYAINNRLSLFFRGALLDEEEQLEPVGQVVDSLSGVERKEMGIAYALDDESKSSIEFGRLEFDNDGEGWLWWRDELDALRLSAELENVEVMLALAQELARSNSDEAFIDPEQEDVQRLLFNLNWAVAEKQSILLYYLDQSDQSGEYRVGEQIALDRSDEADSDLRWKGISYLGQFSDQSLGQLDLELHAAWVDGRETLYQLEQQPGGKLEVSERNRVRVDGEGQGIRARWTPAQLDRWSLLIARTRTSGDSNPDDAFDAAFRNSELQGDPEIFGHLLQPELSNLDIAHLGIEWRPRESISLALYRFEYRQRVAADEIRDAAIEADPSGASKELGKEVDLLLNIEAREDLELSIIAARFNPGQAFANESHESSSYLKLELVYTF